MNSTLLPKLNLSMVIVSLNELNSKTQYSKSNLLQKYDQCGENSACYYNHGVN